MITRDLSEELLILTSEYPVVTVLGPRQAGKTMIAREVLPEHAYFNLEAPEVRHFAESDLSVFIISSALIYLDLQELPASLVWRGISQMRITA